MAEPQIQFARAADGVNIAFWTMGEGPPLVLMPANVYSHVQLEWEWPEWRRWYERLARTRMIVKYDGRGCGLSDRSISDMSIDTAILDLQAVTDHLGVDTFRLLGNYASTLPAVAFAVRHPERVTRLILWSAFARFSDISPAVQLLAEIADKDWPLFTETVAQTILGWPEGGEARRFAAFIRECTTADIYTASVNAFRSADVTALLPQVSRPTLVVHRRQVVIPTLDMARGVAARIPGAALSVLEGSSREPFLGDAESVALAIDQFLGDGPDSPPPAAIGGLVTILFTDLTSSTALTQRLGDAKAQELVRAHNSIVREALAAQGGTEVKHTGDGIMASFPTASGALECAVAIQLAVPTPPLAPPPQGEGNTLRSTSG